MADALRTMRTRPATMSSIRASATTASCGTVTVTAADDGTGGNGDTDTGNGDTGTGGSGDTGTGTDEPSGFELGDGLSDIEIAGISATGLAALAAAGYFLSQQQ